MKKLIISAIILITLLASLALWIELDTQLFGLRRNALKDIKAVIYTEKPMGGRALVPGYNYFLLKSYAEDKMKNVQIDIAYRDLSYVDSLKAGAIDMLALDLTESNLIEPNDSSSCFLDSLLSYYTADSSSVWLMRQMDRKNMKDFSAWLKKWELEEGHEEIKGLYFNRFDPFRSRPRAHLSPYDSLIKVNADSIGVDWRFLAALIYKESRFHIEAKSHRGARGIMQMIPSTAAQYGVEDFLDPEINIRAGTQLLDKLLKRYKGIAANREELYKFALGAYNAGHGRIDDMLKLSRMQGLEYSYWDALIEVLPQMRISIRLDDISVRGFNGRETVAYVRDVMNIYKEFQRICPE